MHLIDTHAHIYLPEFDNDREALLGKAAEAGVKQVLMPAIDMNTHEAMLGVEASFPYCQAMMGVHPCSVNETMDEEIRVATDWLQKRKFIAVGEIGLDFYWDKTHVSKQYEAFHRQIALALQYQLPIVIHSREAIDECIEVVKQYPALTGVFHCFSGNREQADKIRNLDFMLGIGGVLTFKNAGLDKVIAKTGMEKVILETDAPYLAPVPFRGKRNEPAYLRYVAEKMQLLTGKGLEEIAALTTENAVKLFNLS